jgi:division protein CdvB (Snf7/Vps24/ESCRT-III family)
MPARFCFRVHRKSDKALKELRVKDLKRKRTQAAETDNESLVKNQFDVIVPEAILFLDSSDGVPAASSSHQPLPGPVVPEASSEPAL